jgi:hypothetical protein
LHVPFHQLSNDVFAIGCAATITTHEKFAPLAETRLQHLERIRDLQPTAMQIGIPFDKSINNLIRLHVCLFTLGSSTHTHGRASESAPVGSYTSEAVLLLLRSD